MKQIKSFEELVINQKILLSHKKKKSNTQSELYNEWFGQYKSKKGKGYYFNLISCRMGHKIRKISLNNSYITDDWKIFKLTKKEFEKYKLKVLINKL